MFIDLHTHSSASDGSCSPSEILAFGSQLGLGALGLTDHDTVSGIPEFLELSEKYPGISVVPGVEVSVYYKNSSIHILGLFIDHNDEALGTMLQEIRKNRDNRNVHIISKLNGMGYEITLEEVEAVAGGESVGRPHFAKILIEKGYFEESQDVFDRCLKRGAPAYCGRVLPTPAEAINAIHGAGGLAFWAHPLHREEGERSYVRSVLADFMTLGLDGIEAYYTTFSEKQHKLIMETAAEYNLLISGGTDFHGDNQPKIRLGSGYGDLKVPFTVLENIRLAHSKKKNK